ncbi:MAG: DUF885 domain-containing protein [Saccharofermentans sp.]|nr:DUF885 domain-containing protein [Saccharofermentans sp.]
MNKKIRTILALTLVMAMSMSSICCASGLQKKDKDNGINYKPTVEDTDDEDEDEDKPGTTGVTEEGFKYAVGENGLTYPTEVAKLSDIHPAHKPGDVEGDDAVDLLKEIEQDVITRSVDNYVDAVILYEDPEAMGIDVSDPSWGDYTVDNEEDLEFYRDVRDRLLTINPDTLDEQDRIFYDKILYDVEESIYAGSFTSFAYYESEFNPLTGPQNDLLFILCVISFDDVEDAEKYIELVEDIDRYFDQICEFEEDKADYGYALSDETYEDIAATFDDLCAQEDTCFLYEDFENRLDNIKGLKDDDRERLIEEHEAAMHDVFFPEMEECADRMRDLKTGEGSDLGVSQYDGGDAYYTYIVRNLSNSSDKSIDDHIDMIEGRLDTIMETYMDALYSGDRSWMSEYLNHDYSKGDTGENLEYLKDAVKGDFPALPDHAYNLMDVPKEFEDSFSPAAYLGYHLDNYNANLIITNNANVNGEFGVTCAHEGYPGHMFQSVYTRSQCDHPYLYLFDSTGYVEGWATYVEEYSFKYFDAEGTAAEMVNIESELNVLLMARWDIGIHYENWSIEDCANFYSEMMDNLVTVEPEDIQDIYNILLSDPCYAVKYGCGFLGTQEVVDQIRAEFPDATDKEIHTAYLNSMPVTFEMILANMENELG